METIYDRLVEQVDIHAHPGVHYAKTESDAKFGYNGGVSFLDADKVDGIHSAALSLIPLPIGSMVAYDGPSTDFGADGYLIADASWHLCDGSTYHGIITPPMAGYFPRCPSTVTATGSGGSSTATPTGTVSFAGHTLLISEIAAHTHTYQDNYGAGAATKSGSGSLYNIQNNATDYERISESTGGDAAHLHDNMALNLNSIDKNPAWVGLYFMMRVQ